MTTMLRTLLFLVLCNVLTVSATAADTTEFRRALLIGNSNSELESALKKRGFLISTGKIADSLSGIPHHGFNLVYYQGIAHNRDGKWHLSTEDLVIENLVSDLQRNNVARHNVLLFDLQNEDEESRKALRSALNGLASKGSSNRGGLAIINKSSSEADSLALQLTKWLGRSENSLRDTFAKTAFVSGETEEPVVLRGKAAQTVSAPDKLTIGHVAGDQWIAPDGMNFVWCPPGKYVMGNAEFHDAQPVSVSIEKGFWISKFELTRLDVATRMKVATTNQSGNNPMHPAGGIRIELLLEPLHEKAAPTGWVYDLPTEVEWEYAARAGSKASLPSSIEKLGQFANFADRSLFNAREEIHFIFAHQQVDDGHAHGFANIGQFLPNAWGIHDMFGNAAEHCAGYYSEEIGTVNYHLKTSRDRPIPILRGGSWCTPVANLHVAYRTGYNGDETLAYNGARLVIRQGARVTRTHKELVTAKQAEEAAARGKK